MLPPDRARRLRAEVAALRARESRRSFDAMVYVGDLAEQRHSFVVRAQDLPAMDTGLRIDVVSSLLGGTGPQCRLGWVARPGVPEVHDVDLAWYAATSLAFGTVGRRLDGFFAITRAGWLDVLTGENRVWRRLRL